MPNKILESYEERLLGLPYPIILRNIAEAIQHPTTGKRIGVAVPDSEGVAQIVAAVLCFLPARLISQEYKLIRRVVAMNTEDFANCISSSVTQLSRCEEGVEPTTGSIDKLVRLTGLLFLEYRIPKVLCGMGQTILTMRPLERVENVHPLITITRNADCSFAVSVAFADVTICTMHLMSLRSPAFGVSYDTSGDTFMVRTPPSPT